MRVLLDTNILIGREDNKIIDQNLQILLRILNKLKINIVLHPKSIEDIKRDKDTKRKKILLSKFKTYNHLEDFSEPSDSFIKLIGEPKSINDIIDNYLLFAVYRNAVTFLITEDIGLHKKAQNVSLSDRVLKVIESLELFAKELPKEVRLPPALKETTMANLDVNDLIFDSLRIKYPGFNIWFRDKANDGRKCWIYLMRDGSLGAVLIYKFEQESIPSLPPLPEKKRLKIATMKVSHVGHKIGELLLKKSFELAIRNNIPEIYITHFTEKIDYLVDLIQEYGFIKIATVNRDWTVIPEDVYLKKILINDKDIKSISPFQISKSFYPNLYDGIRVKKHIVPIQPQYHELLFTDYPGRQTTLNEHMGQLIIEGNTIKKAYLSHSSSKKLETGDILLFYRSVDVKSVVSLGVIESVFYDLTYPNEIISIVGKRTVYSFSEIKEIAKSPTTIILFNFHFHFKKPIKYKTLLNQRILKGPSQSISEIDHDQYLFIKRRGGIDERFTFN